MDQWTAILLPFVLLMSRVAAFIVVVPIFGMTTVPAVARIGLVLLLSVFFAAIMPPGVSGVGVHWLHAVVLILQEAIIGLALGLAARLVFLAVEQGGLIAAQQMGFADVEAIDPLSEAQDSPVAALFEMTFALLFLTAGGHQLLLRMLAQSFRSFPLAGNVNVAVLTDGLVEAGSAMLLLALKLAAPLLGGFLILAVLLCILARVLPEMNILLESFPLRVGMGLFMAAAIMPSLETLTNELARWMSRLLTA